MGYSTRQQEKFIGKNIIGLRPVMEVVDMYDQEMNEWWSMEEEPMRPVAKKKVHNQIQKIRVEDSKLGVDVKEVLVNGRCRIVGGDDGCLRHVASVVLFSRPAALPASPLGGGKTPINPAC